MNTTTQVEFECRDCGAIFTWDVGRVSVDPVELRPRFEKQVRCPRCGPRTIDQLFLTELGQSQLTAATWGMI